MLARIALPLLLALVSAPTFASQAADPRPVESFVAPSHLFPMEGTAFMDEAGNPVAYAPLAAWDAPGGRRLGEVRLEQPGCVLKPDAKECAQGLRWHLQTSSGALHAVPTREFRYEGAGLVSYVPSVRLGKEVWSRIEYARGSFWVNTPAVVPYESLATVITSFDLWCARPGQCAAPSKEMLAEVARVDNGEFRVAGCYSHAYLAEGIVTHGGKRYYRASLVEIEPGAKQPKLPRTGFVPVRRVDGTHTGDFYSRGC